MKEDDKLKNFVDKHRSKMDYDTPPVFNRKKHVPKKPKMVKLSAVLKVAAIALAIVTVGGVYLTSPKVFNSKEEISVIQTEKDITLAMLSEELGEMEAYYTKQIDETYHEIEEEGMVEEVVDQLELLDEEFSDLKKELEEGIDMVVVVENMIENYRMKLKLLENVLKKIKQKENIELDTKLNSNEKYIVYT